MDTGTTVLKSTQPRDTYIMRQQLPVASDRLNRFALAPMFFAWLLSSGCTANLPDAPTTLEFDPVIAAPEPEALPTNQTALPSPEQQLPEPSLQVTPQFDDLTVPNGLTTDTSSSIDTLNTASPLVTDNVIQPATEASTSEAVVPEVALIESTVINQPADPIIDLSSIGQSQPSNDKFNNDQFNSEVTISANESALSTTSGCPNIAELQPLEDGGCTLTMDAQLAVTFFINSDKLTKEAFRTLDRVTDALATWPVSTIEIDAHTDNRGDPAKNLALSISRGRAVAKYFESKGFALDSIEARAFAGERPIASNETATGRRTNRRVELRFF